MFAVLLPQTIAGMTNNQCGYAQARLQRLPQELQLEIISNLDYRSAICFSQANRYFHNITNPQACAVEDKSSFVKSAEKFD